MIDTGDRGGKTPARTTWSAGLQLLRPLGGISMSRTTLRVISLVFTLVAVFGAIPRAAVAAPTQSNAFVRKSIARPLTTQQELALKAQVPEPVGIDGNTGRVVEHRGTYIRVVDLYMHASSAELFGYRAELSSPTSSTFVLRREISTKATVLVSGDYLEEQWRYDGAGVLIDYYSATVPKADTPTNHSSYSCGSACGAVVVAASAAAAASCNRTGPSPQGMAACAGLAIGYLGVATLYCMYCGGLDPAMTPADQLVPPNDSYAEWDISYNSNYPDGASVAMYDHIPSSYRSQSPRTAYAHTAPFWTDVDCCRGGNHVYYPSAIVCLNVRFCESVNGRVTVS